MLVLIISSYCNSYFPLFEPFKPSQWGFFLLQTISPIVEVDGIHDLEKPCYSPGRQKFTDRKLVIEEEKHRQNIWEKQITLGLHQGNMLIFNHAFSHWHIPLWRCLKIHVTTFINSNATGLSFHIHFSYLVSNTLLLCLFGSMSEPAVFSYRCRFISRRHRQWRSCRFRVAFDNLYLFTFSSGELKEGVALSLNEHIFAIKWFFVIKRL